MERNHYGGEAGFSILELMIVMSIIGILITIAIFSYISAIDRIKLQSDVRALNGEFQLARMRSISTAIGHGVAFWRRDGKNKGNAPDAYFVFVDCNNDLLFTDNDSNPGNNKPVDDWSKCNNTLGYDPILRGENYNQLSAGDYFSTIFGSTNLGSWTKGGALEFVAFNSLGQAMWGPNLVTDGDVYIQNHHHQKGDNTVDRSGVHIYGATGTTDLIPMGRGVPF